MNKGVYYAAFTALLWGFLAIALKVSVNELPPVTVTWLRFAIAFTVLLAWYLLFDRPKIKIIAKPPVFALIAGFSLGLNYIGFITGIHHTTPVISQVFIQTGPVMLAVSGFVIFKEKVTIRQGFGLLVVLTGMVVFYHEKIIVIAGGLANYKTGVLWILFGALCWAVYAIFQKKSVAAFNPMALNLVIFGVPMLYLLPFVEFGKILDISFGFWLLVLFLGLNTLGAYGSLAYALKYLEANKISVIITMNPLITFAAMALLSYNNVSWIQAETFTAVTIAGAITVIAGVMMVVFKKK
ncbi:MAG: DMT family transporter [Bacteroidales bacterium]|nr:DMT family transporter [Bacteroidales bacterium]